MFRLICFGICCISFGWTTAYVVSNRDLLDDGKILGFSVFGILTTFITCCITFYTTHLLLAG